MIKSKGFLLLSLVLACLSASCSRADRDIRAVENGLLPGIATSASDGQGFNILERMRAHHVPGVSLAVVHHGKIAWAKGYGVLEAGSKRRVEPSTPFQTGSAGKMIAALTVLSLANKGLLDLDEDVDRYLRSWKIPPSPFTTDAKVTLRRLLSHTAGVQDDLSAPFRPDSPLPSLTGHLENNHYDIVRTPGEAYAYSGAGYIIVEQIIEDVVGKPYRRVASEEVLKPLGMAHTSFEIELTRRRASEAALAHHANGELYEDKYPVYPCFAPGTCNWSTAGDMAKLFVEIHKSYSGRSNRILPEALTKSMLTRLSEAYGLGIKVIEDGRETLIGHSGDFYGFHACVYGYLESGDGIVVMTNGDDGVRLYNEIIRSVSKHYGWPGCRQETASSLRWDDIDIGKLCGTYFLPGKLDILNVYAVDGKLRCDVLGKTGAELVPVSPLRFYEGETDGTIGFRPASDGRVQGVEFRRIGVRLTGYPLAGFDLLYDDRYPEGNRLILQAKEAYAGKPDFENVFNSIGYALMARQQFENAINAFELGLALYPASANLFDSLGEAYMKSGNAVAAIQSYERSLELNPENDYARTMLKRLKTAA